MQHKLYISILCLALAASCVSCGKPAPEDAPEPSPEDASSAEADITTLLSDAMSPKEILDLTAGLENTMSYSEDWRVISSSENEGYYEVVWDTGSGDTLKVTYVDEIGGPNYTIYAEDPDGHPVCIDHSSEEDMDYTCVYNELYRVTYPNGTAAKPAYIESYASNPLIWGGYSLEDDKYVLTSASIFKEDGYYDWYDNGIEMLVAPKEDSVSTLDPSTFANLDGGSLYYQVGGHKLSYIGNADAQDWYLTTTIYVAYKDAAKAEVFADAHNLTARPWSTDDSVTVVELEDAALKLSDQFTGLHNILVELWDPTDVSINAFALDEDGSLLAAEPDEEIGYLSIY